MFYRKSVSKQCKKCHIPTKNKININKNLLKTEDSPSSLDLLFWAGNLAVMADCQGYFFSVNMQEEGNNKSISRFSKTEILKI